MKRVCAWCDKVLGTMVSKVKGDITHGICQDCLDKLLANNKPATMSKYINKFEFPVIEVDGTGRIVLANVSASKMLGKHADKIKDELCGDAFDCVYAELPGGCGQTEHCAICTVRNAVTETYNTGKPLINLEAYQNIKTSRGVKKKRFVISTEKIFDLVLLRIKPKKAK